MKASYRKHHRADPEGHIFIEKPGAVTITLKGAAAMTQAELDFYGEIFAEAIRNMSPGQQKQARGLAVPPTG